MVLESKRMARQLKMRRIPGFEILGEYLLENSPEPAGHSMEQLLPSIAI